MAYVRTNGTSVASLEKVTLWQIDYETFTSNQTYTFDNLGIDLDQFQYIGIKYKVYDGGFPTTPPQYDTDVCEALMPASEFLLTSNPELGETSYGGLNLTARTTNNSDNVVRVARVGTTVGDNPTIDKRCVYIDEPHYMGKTGYPSYFYIIPLEVYGLR